MSSMLPLYHSISIVHPCLSMLSLFPLRFPLPPSWLWSMANVPQVSSLPVKISCLNMYKNSRHKVKTLLILEQKPLQIARHKQGNRNNRQMDGSMCR